MAGARKKPNKQSGKYQGYFIGADGKRKWFLGTHSRRDTIKMAEKLEDEAREVHLGYRPPATAAARHRSRPFMEVVEEHIAWGRTFGRRGKPWGETRANRKRDYLTKWAETLGLQTLADLDGLLPRVEAVVHEFRERGFTGSTLDSWVRPLTSFCNWAVVRGYLTENPLKGLSAIDTEPERERRALTPDEIGRLFSVAPVWRQMLYATAITTGLRLNELRGLDRTALDVDNSRLALPGKFTKNGKPACQYLPAKLTAGLAGFADSGTIPTLYAKARTERTLPENPLLYVPTHALKMLDKDLEQAGIPKKSAEGCVDFHALRVASITLAAEVGANVKELQAFARHADPRLTTRVYAKKRDPRMMALAERMGENLPLEGESEARSATEVHFEAGADEQHTRKSLPQMALSLSEKTRSPSEGRTGSEEDCCGGITGPNRCSRDTTGTSDYLPARALTSASDRALS
jgi:integrase/recombinase XerD